MRCEKEAQKKKDEKTLSSLCPSSSSPFSLFVRERNKGKRASRVCFSALGKVFVPFFYGEHSLYFLSSLCPHNTRTIPYDTRETRTTS
jgi:hypothetical protein